jgi:hypothetical protein
MYSLKITNLVRSLTVAQMLILAVPAHAVQRIIQFTDKGSWTISLDSPLGEQPEVVVDADKPGEKVLTRKNDAQILTPNVDHILTFSGGIADQGFSCDLRLTANRDSQYAGTTLTFTATVNPRGSSVLKSKDKLTCPAGGPKPTVSWDKHLKFGEPAKWIQIQ